MENYVNQRMVNIRTMLLEMASGNFHFRIGRTEKTDNTEALIVTLNMLAEELQDSMVHKSHVNRDTTYLDIVQMTFILDEKGTVRMANQEVLDTLSRSQDEVMENSFSSLLDDQSAKLWMDAWNHHKDQLQFNRAMSLTFLTKFNLTIPKTAYISRFKDHRTGDLLTSVIIVHHTTQHYKLHSELIKTLKDNEDERRGHPQGDLIVAKPKLNLNSDDIKKIKTAHQLLTNRPEDDFPPLKEFALQIGTNEFKLKTGFKELYGTTVHHFLMEQRLRVSLKMVQYSDRSFKTVAHMSGFNSTAHFSRSFKKKYGFSPTELRKKTFRRNKK